MYMYFFLMADFCGFEIPKKNEFTKYWGLDAPGFDILNSKEFKKKIPVTVFDTNFNMHLARLAKSIVPFTDKK